VLCNVSLNTSIACSLICLPGMTSSLAKVNKSSGAHCLALFLKFFNFLIFLNIRIDLLILKTYYGRFTLKTKKKSLHIIFKDELSVLCRPVCRGTSCLLCNKTMQVASSGHCRNCSSS